MSLSREAHNWMICITSMIFAVLAGLGAGGNPFGISLTVTIFGYFFIVMVFAFLRYTDEYYKMNARKRG